MQSCGIHVESKLISGPLAWVMVVIVFFGGEEYGYVAEIGESSLTEKQAEDVATRLGGRKKAYSRFLSEVYLETMH